MDEASISAGSSTHIISALDHIEQELSALQQSESDDDKLTKSLSKILKVRAHVQKLDELNKKVQEILAESRKRPLKQETDESTPLPEIPLIDEIKPTHKKHITITLIKKLQSDEINPAKEELFKTFFRLLKSYIKHIGPDPPTHITKKVLESIVPYLMKNYEATMCPSNQMIFEIITYFSTSKLELTIESIPLFGSKLFNTKPSSIPQNSNPLSTHSIRTNVILDSLNDDKAYHTCLLYDDDKLGTSSASYDLKFVLPLLCNILDEKNVCEGSRVISNGWIYFIIRGIGLKDEGLRAQAFLAFQKLLINLENSKKARNKDIKLWLYFLNCIKRGIVELGECQLSHLLSTWLIGTWEVIKQPSNVMFQKVTTSLFAKPKLEMTILPDFFSFFNDGDYKREGRAWILNILYHGLKTREDWLIAQKLPTIKLLCSAFLLEKVRNQRTILGILIHGSKIPVVAEEMVDKYSIPLWIANLHTTNRSVKEEIEILLNNLVETCPRNPTREVIYSYVSHRRQAKVEIKKEEIDEDLNMEIEVGN